MFNKLKTSLAALLSALMLITLVPVSSGYRAEAADETQNDIQIIRDDPSALDWEAEEVAYIDFSEIDQISLTDGAEGHGITLLPNSGATSWKAANRLSDDGYMLLGKDSNTDGSDPETFDIGHIYLRLDIPLEDKADTPYAVKLDYYGGGIAVDGGSYVDLYYNSTAGKEASSRITYGSDTYNTGKVETKYYSLPEADFAESVGTPKGDIRLSTWNNAQLKIRRVSIVKYDPLDIPEMVELSKGSESEEPIAKIDFSDLSGTDISNGAFEGDGLTLLTTQATGSTTASNRMEDGYLLLGKQARQTETDTLTNGAVYIKLDIPLVEKAETPYAVKIEYYGGGLGVDSGSYINLRYNSTSSDNSAKRNTYGSAYNSGKLETMYYLLDDADFSETIRDSGCGADFRLETWCGNGTTTGAQLKIKSVSVVAYDSENPPADPSSLFPSEAVGEIPDDTVFINPNKGQYYGITYSSGTPVVQIIDKDGAAHYAAQSVDYLNFKITDPEVKAADKVTLIIRYWDIGKRTFSVEYNAETPDPLPENTSESYYTYFSTSSIEMTDSKELLTVEIPLENAAFAGKQNGANDFRIRSMYITDFYIEEVAVRIGVEDVTQYKPPEFPEMTDINNFKDKTVVGYQAWFKASDSETSGWDHWNSGSAPAGGKQTFDVYPDVSEYPDSVLYQTGYADLLNGQPAVLYDGTSKEAIDLQVKWMQEYGIDGFAVSRFYSGTSSFQIPGTNKIDYMVESAEKYDRLFYLGYDLSGIGGNGESGIRRLQFDFVLNVEQKFVSSPNYAQIDGKPVVSLWGFQGSQFDRYPNTENALMLINWFKERGYYVIGGVPDNDWANDTSDYAAVYEALDMITPWTVGRFNHTNAQSYLEGKYEQDRAWLDDYNAEHPDDQKEYMPTIFPGFSWANWASGAPNSTARLAGEFMWDQATLAKKYGFTSSFIAMFDEYDEGTSILKMAEDSMSIPSDQYFVTAAADGKWLSSDFYMRLTGAISDMLRGELPATDDVPIPHATGPVFWRNGFERRYINYKGNNNQITTALANIDVCVPDGEVLINNGIEDLYMLDMYEDPYKEGYTTTGDYSFKLNGLAAPESGKGQFYFQIAETDIEVRDNMVLSYNLRSDNDLGGFVFVDLMLDNGKKLSEINGSKVKAKRGTDGEWTPVTLALDSSLTGRTIESVIIAYESEYTGEFDAYIDDIVIEYADATQEGLKELVARAESIIAGANAESYTAASVKDLQAAVSKANSLINSGSASESALKAAYYELVDAMNALVGIVKTKPVAEDPDENKTPSDMNNNQGNSQNSSQNNNESSGSDNNSITEEPEETPEEPIENPNESTDKTPEENPADTTGTDTEKGSSIPWLLIGIIGGVTVVLLGLMVIYSVKKGKKS